MKHEYELGYYVTEDLFLESANIEQGKVLVYCYDSITKNESNKFDGVWHLFVYREDTNNWHMLVKAKPVNRRIVPREFSTADGLINSLLRYNFPLVGLSKEQGSGCEISMGGDVSYINECLFK